MAENTYGNTFKGRAGFRGPASYIPSAKDNNPIQFTGIVVSYNEGEYLRNCLRSLAFCEELIVIDLGSADDSVEIAKTYNARVIPHQRVPVVEEIRNEAINYSKNDWIILADPDEVFPADIADKLKALIMKDSKLGLINVPLQYYFKKRPLYFTVWGTKRSRQSVLHRRRNRFNPDVHRGIQLMEGYHCAEMPRRPDQMIKHYWIGSFRQLFGKHWRYINREGESRYRVGERFSWRRWARETINALRLNLFAYDGIRGGLLGVFLSGFYSWYIAMSLLSLRHYQKVLRQYDLNGSYGINEGSDIK